MDNVSSQHVGESIRLLRKQKGLTLSKLAGLCQCSPSLLSQIETAAVNPSFSTLKVISDALGVPMASLVTGMPVVNGALYSLMKPRERKKLSTQGGVNFQLLSRSIDLNCEFILNEWPPGTSTGTEAYIHNGQECGFLLEGELDVEINGEVHRMKAGDTITLISSVPHRISNPGKQKAVAVWVNSVPYVFTVK